MKISDKLLKKYAAVSPLLPPGSDEMVEVLVPKDPPKDPELLKRYEGDVEDIDPKWKALIEEAEGMDPLTEKPAQTEEEILETLQGTPMLHDIPTENIGGDLSTKPPPGKKANLSADTLLKMCSQYHDLCSKF